MDLLYFISNIFAFILTYVIFNNGTRFTTKKIIDPKLDSVIYKMFDFYFDQHIYQDSLNEPLKIVYINIIDKVKKLNIFFGESTIVYKGSNKIKQDELVAVSTLVIPPYIYSISHERISTLFEDENIFIFCMSACQENLIDGYYRICVELKEDNIHIKYNKIQNFNNNFISYLLYYLNPLRDYYVNSSIKSVINTVNNLTNANVANTNNVKWKII